MANLSLVIAGWCYHSGLFAVCDGMGGEEYGEKASLFAVENLKEFQNKDV